MGLMSPSTGTSLFDLFPHITPYRPGTPSYDQLYRRQHLDGVADVALQMFDHHLSSLVPEGVTKRINRRQRRSLIPS
jgi:hypothetical protein